MKVIWTKPAENSYTDIIDYLVQRFSNKVTLEFTNKVDKAVTKILDNPEIGRKYKNTKFRKLLVTKQTALIYYIDRKNDFIRLDLLWVSHLNPDKLDDFISKL